MEKVINKQNVKQFAYVNDAVCKRPIRGIVLNFFGLNNTSTFSSDTAEGRFFGERGIVYITPYTNPWAWMNAQTVAFVDDVVAAVSERLGLDNDLPIVSSGESMGGQSALTYCVYAKRTPVSCVVNCPVCDTLYHYSERDDLPRTMYSALCTYEASLEQALRSVSPLHLADRMPHIEYCIFHCEADKAVNIRLHSDVFVAAMRRAGRNVLYHTVPNRGHCDLDENARKLYAQYIADAIEKHR